MSVGSRHVAGGATSWDTFAPTRPFQAFWVGLGVLFLLPGLVLTALRVVPPTEDAPALVASFSSYAVLLYVGSLCSLLVALVRARRRSVLSVLAILTATLLVCHVAWLAPLFRADNRPASTDSFSLMSLNLLHGRADPRAVAQQAMAADVVVLLETTHDSLAEISRYGWNERFPHHAGRPEGGAGSTVLYSRFPVSEATSLSRAQSHQWISTVDVPQVGAVRIIAAHPCNPYCGDGLWDLEHRQLTDAAAANGSRPLVVAGDLNAVHDHAPMMALRRVGLTSSTDILGAGWLPTYPVRGAVPPLLPIDHVLVNRFLTATSIERLSVPGTDHLGLLVAIAGTG